MIVSLHLFHTSQPAGEVLQRRGHTAFVQTRFSSTSGELCAVEPATLIQHRSD
jgi:hypothetical protein